tara:strand:- start:76 stop:243 length:168 start_codon:yes stop_codon:yes gene_type:complete
MAETIREDVLKSSEWPSFGDTESIMRERTNATVITENRFFLIVFIDILLLQSQLY